MFNLSFLFCVRHLNFKRWIETINSTKKIGNTFSFFLSLLETNKCWRICWCNLCAPLIQHRRTMIWFFALCRLVSISSSEFFWFCVFFFREIWSRYWIFYGMFNPTEVDVISHSFISLGISIDWTSVYKHANASALWFFVYLFIFFFRGAHRSHITTTYLRRK